MKKLELLFIPSPGLSHLIPTVETAKLLLRRDGRLAATVLLLPSFSDDAAAAAAETSYPQKLPTDDIFPSRLKFINLPNVKHSHTHFFEHFDVQIPNVRNQISDLIKSESGGDFRIAAVVLDLFCAEFVGVAGEFGLPAYLLFTGGAICLGLFQHLVSLKFQRGEDLTRYRKADVALPVPCFALAVPARVLPAVMVEERLFPDVFLSHFKRFSEMRGVLINTFYELESYAVDSLVADDRTPEIYPIGPVLDKKTQQFDNGDDELKKWLDDQPEKSVVFLCFGTGGKFDEIQIGEIAKGLEESGARFLWSLRAGKEDDLKKSLPEGFLERSGKVGRVIGWAPQVAVLAHPAVGGFVSHCGWNSILESVWFGVPVATFPLHAEQQLNAFYLVEEMGMAEAITIDYKMDFTGENPPESVRAEVIAAAVRRLVAAEGGSGVRRKVEEMREKARGALVEGGSSYNAQTLFIEDVMKSINA